MSTAKVGEDTRALYRALNGFGHGVLMIAAEQVGRASRAPSLDKVQKLMMSWQEKGLTDEAEVRAYLTQVEQENARLASIGERCGAVKHTEENRKKLRRWLQEWRLP